MIVYGLNPVEALVRSKPEEIDRLVVSARGGPAGALATEARRAGVLVEFRPRAALDRMAGTSKHQGLVAVVREFEYADPDGILGLDPRRPILALDGVEDPRNLGALVRSARAFGAIGVIVPRRGSAGITSVAIKAAAGAATELPVARVANLSRALRDLRAEGRWIVGLDRDGEDMTGFDLARELVLVLGGEGKGLRPSIARQCDAVVSIPMWKGWDSLNVSCAGAIVLHEAARQGGWLQDRTAVPDDGAGKPDNSSR